MSTTTSVKVALRVRPMTVKETLDNATECLLYIPQSPQVVIGFPDAPSSQKSFTYDHVFSPSSTQNEIYNACVRPLLDEFLKGFNATILAYGQTGSGKTYSMGTGFEEFVSSEEQGIVPRAIDELFARLEQESAKDQDFTFQISVSFLELYNEELVDLLSPKGQSTTSAPSIREHAGKIVWSGITTESVNSPQELFQVLHRGSLCRTTGATDMNAVSSRSHAIFSVSLTQEKKMEMSEANDNSRDVRKFTSQFHFVDLAGSERLKKTNSEGDRKKEGISINQGLLALGNVISALGDDSRKAGHVPYRDSKLTRMLQDSLGGNSQTLMLACVSPSDSNYSETLSTLHYANRAKNIKNKVTINEDFSSNNNAEIRSLRGLVLQLRTELALLRPEGTSTYYDRLHSDLQTPLPTDSRQEPRFVIQREKELLREVEDAKQELETSKIEHDRLVFVCNRLAERNNVLLHEVTAILSERDQAILDKCIHLSPSFSKNVVLHEKSENSSRESLDTKSSESEADEEPSSDKMLMLNQNHVRPIQSLLKGYMSTISELRQRLSEAQDQVGWCSDFFARIGKSSQASLSSESLEKLLIPPHKRLEAVRKGWKDERSEEKETLQTFRDDPRLERLLRDSAVDCEGHLEDETRVKLFGLPHISTIPNCPSRLKIETTFDMEPIVYKDAYVSGDSDMYTMLHKIQTDISEHEALMDRIARREAEYDMMKKAYEQKMNALHHQLNQYQSERDLALNKLKNPSKDKQDANRAMIISSKFEERKRKLELQLEDYRRKLENNMRHQSENRSRNDALTRDLKSTIEAMKNEKAKVLKQLRKETQMKLDIATTSQREIAKWKRKGKLASEMTKKLERSNQLQRLMLKKKSEEVIKSQHKLRNVMSLLKRSSTPSKISKPGSAYCQSPVKKLSRAGSRRGHFQNSGDRRNMSSLFESIDRVTQEELSKTEANARLKYDILEKELITCIATRQSRNVIASLIHQSKRLLGEQQELLAERSRIVTTDFERTGIYDADSPQYMDERLGVVECELATIDSKIRVVQEHLLRSGSITDFSSFEKSLQMKQDPFFESEQTDLPWENCINLIQSFSRRELDIVSIRILEDLVNARLEADDKAALLEERNQKLVDLQFLIDQLRSKELEGEIKSTEEIPQSVDEDTKQDTVFLRHVESSDTVRDDQASAFGDQQGEATIQEEHLEGESPDKRSSLYKPRYLSHQTDLGERSLSMASLKTVIGTNQASSTDVFERLASSHTLASQAKVIPKLTLFIDKDLPDLHYP